jgi:nitrogen fixation protein NifU and related proteins
MHSRNIHEAPHAPDTISCKVLQSFYREIVLDHFQRPRNRRELEDADIHEHIDNPLCGDVVTVYAKVHDGSFEEVSFTGRGCSISQASASMLTEQLTGKSREEAEEKMRTDESEELGELAALKGVVQTPNRIRCATLAWDAMRRALPTL